MFSQATILHVLAGIDSSISEMTNSIETRRHPRSGHFLSNITLDSLRRSRGHLGAERAKVERALERAARSQGLRVPLATEEARARLDAMRGALPRS